MLFLEYKFTLQREESCLALANLEGNGDQVVHPHIQASLCHRTALHYFEANNSVARVVYNGRIEIRKVPWVQRRERQVRLAQDQPYRLKPEAEEITNKIRTFRFQKKIFR
jgi:hypothetical protein